MSNSAIATVPSANADVPVTFNAPATVSVTPLGTVTVSPDVPISSAVPL